VPHAIAPRSVPRDAVRHRLGGTTMGTSWSVTFIAARAAPLAAIGREIGAELDLVVSQMSSWEPASDLARFNRAPAGSWQAIPDAFAEVLSCALAVAHDSDGAFDPCAGALVNAWGFGPHGRFRDVDFQLPDIAQVDAARAVGGWCSLDFDRARQRLRQPGGLQLDLSAIAKGYAVDRVAQALQRECDDQRVFMRHGVRHPHTIDPRSGRPIAHGVCAVSVLHPSCMWADALSTALTVLGPDAGLAWAEAREIAALWTTRRRDGGFDETMSRACAALAQ
jgi:thiamine biosynthesis lipoprotein